MGAAARSAQAWRCRRGPGLALAPTQTVENPPDGGVEVRFRASGMRELAWHLSIWGSRSRSSRRSGSGQWWRMRWPQCSGRLNRP